jgi:hypothetical protein
VRRPWLLLACSLVASPVLAQESVAFVGETVDNQVACGDRGELDRALDIQTLGKPGAVEVYVVRQSRSCIILAYGRVVTVVEASEALPHNKFRAGYPSDFPGTEKAIYWYTFRGVKPCPDCRKPPRDSTP